MVCSFSCISSSPMDAYNSSLTRRRRAVWVSLAVGCSIIQPPSPPTKLFSLQNQCHPSARGEEAGQATGCSLLLSSSPPGVYSTVSKGISSQTLFHCCLFSRILTNILKDIQFVKYCYSSLSKAKNKASF